MNKPNDTNEPSPASAGSRANHCRCGLATRLVGDGCEHCNPAMVIDILREQVADMRLTEAEQLAVAWAAREADEWDEEDAEVAAHAEALRGLAKRLF